MLRGHLSSWILLKALRTRSAGKSLSLIHIVTILSDIVGPLVGALLIVRSSFTSLFFLVSVILVCSVIPLFKRGDYKVQGRVAVARDVVTTGSHREAWMCGLYGLNESTVDILWSVFLFLHYPHLLP